ncbi:hypothetical protein Hanom_Chr03g00238171 [Helianthus anomalus]
MFLPPMFSNDVLTPWLQKRWWRLYGGTRSHSDHCILCRRHRILCRRHRLLHHHSPPFNRDKPLDVAAAQGWVWCLNVVQLYQPPPPSVPMSG